MPRCVDFNWSDDDFTGWDYSLANRMSFAHRLYDPGNHTPIPPLSASACRSLTPGGRPGTTAGRPGTAGGRSGAGRTG